MRKVITIFVATVVLMISGCPSTGLSPRTSPASYAEFVYGWDDKGHDVASVVTQTPAISNPLVFPIHIALAQIGENSPPEPLLNALRAAPELVSRVTPLPLPSNAVPSTGKLQTSDQRLLRLRDLARQLGAEYLFVVGGNIDARTARTSAELLDLLLLPAWLIPSRQIIMESKAVGGLLRVADGRLVLMVDSNASGSSYVATAFEHQRYLEMSIQQRDTLSVELADNLIADLRQRRNEQ